MKEILHIGSVKNEDKISSRVQTDGNIKDVVQAAALGISEMIRIIVRDSNGELTKGDVYNSLNTMIIKDIYEDIR